MNFKRNALILILLFTLMLSVGIVSASEDYENLTADTIDMIDYVSVYQDEDVDLANDVSKLETSQEELKTTTDDDVIVVGTWDELQYYCAQTDKDYTLKLKEDTNFYPSNPTDTNQQIKIKNNVKIIGGERSYIGDNSSDARMLKFIAILVEDNINVGLTLDNITFKWIQATYPPKSLDGIFIQMGGKKTSVIKNCQFSDIKVKSGHATIVYLKRGSTIIDNCSFINCTSNYGVVSVYDPSSTKSTNMIVRNCYFENNYASTEPGCINNCGKLTVYNTTFVKNRSFWWAGAIHTHGGGNTTIYDSNFTDNVAGWNGGALYTYSYLQIYNTVFSGNNCTTNNGGGAIGACAYHSNPHIYIEGCLFENNANNCWALDELSTIGTGRGGAISIMDEGSIEVRDTTFIANAASIGAAICAWAMEGYGSPSIIISNNSFINHTREGDTLNVRYTGMPAVVENNYFEGNSIVFSNLTLTKLSEGREQATLQINASLKNPTYYDDDILDKTLYDVYINNKYVKTLSTNVFTVDFGDLDICDVYVIPTISNRKSNEVTITSTRDYVFVSKSNGNDSNNGISRDSPVNTIKRALELARNCQNIILLDGDFSESDIQIDYAVSIKGEGNATLTGATSFIANSDLTLKNLKISNLNTEKFINQNKDNLVISNCIFINNNAILVYNNGFTSLTNSILLNNSKIIHGNLKDCVLDYNWWGNVPSTLNNYITLNLTSDVDALENNQNAIVKAVFYLNDGTKYVKLPEINLDINTVNGVVSQNNVGIDSNVVYTLTAFDDGVLTVSYNNVNVTKSFEFLKSNPDISLSADDVMAGNNIIVTVSTPSDAGGNLTCNIGNLSQTKVIQSKVTTFTFDNLKADTYTIALSYSGDRKYLSKDLISSVNVNKYESTTSLNISTVNVGDDVILTITTMDSATGNVTLSINNNVQTLTLVNSKTSYTIKNIKRGDYLISVVYNGDDKYLTSEDSKFIEVDNLNASMTVEAEDITYGGNAIVKVTLNDDATGEVIVTIDGITNSSKVINGKAEVSFANLDAGLDKNISVFYSGDDTYFNLTRSCTFNIAKADLVFSISSSDIKIGQFAEITIVVPQRTSGTFTINNEIINIPLSGEISYVIGDLEIGNYTFTAVYNGNNYYTVSKSVSFEVSEYDAPQWANEGSNTENTHKSPYETETNGEIAFTIPFNETLSGELAIGSSGNLYLTTQDGVYCFNQTNRLWYFSSDAAAGYLSGIAIGRDVVIAPKSGDTLYFINQTTGERFGESNIYQGSSFYAPVIDSNATLFIVSEYQFTSEDYKLTVIPYRLWEKGGDPILVTIGNTEPICSPTVNENIIVVLTENRLRLIDAKTLNTISIKQGNYLPVRPIIGEGNIVYIVLSDSIVAYNSNGVQVWKTKVTGGVGNTLVLDPEQYVYHVNARNILYKYDLIGGSQSRVSNLKVTSGVLVGEDGTLYFGSNNLFYAMDSEGNVLWKSDLNSKIIGNPVMDKNGLIYVPTENGISALTYAPLKDPEFKIVADDIVEGEKATVTITWNNLTTGLVAVSVNGEDVSVDADDGKFTKIISGLEMGYHDISISYSGDMRFSETAMSKSFVVRSGDDVANNIIFDGNSTFTFNLNNASGNLTVKINGKIYADVLVDGQASITVDDLAPGDYEALAIYSGDDLYASANRTFSLSVPKFSVDLNESINTENVVANITVTLPVDATGNVTLSVGTKKYTQKLVDGNAVIVVVDLPAGNYSAVLSYFGDSNYESASKNIELKLVKIPVELNEDNLVIDSPSPTPSISIQLDTPATGVLTVKVYGNEYSSNLVNGSASVIVDDLNPGIYSAEIIYSGDNKYSKASKTVQLEVPKINIKFNDSNLIVDNLTVRVVLDSDASGKLSGIVADRQFSQDVERGIAEINVEGVSPGTYNVVVVYSGDEKYVGANKTVSITVPKIQSNMDNLTVKSDSISVDFGNDATGMITVTVNGKDFSTEVIDGVSNINITGLAPGNYSALVKYSGDNNYTNASKFVEIDVPKIEIGLDDVSVVASSDLTKIVVNLPVDATGTIVVKVNGKEYSANVIGGVLNINIAGLAPGNYSAIVTYSGDNNYTNASKIIDIKVPKIILEFNESTLSFEKHENNVTFTFNLPSNVTGDVIVSINGENYTATLRDGKAIIEVNDLRTGNYGALVKYAGDDNYEVIADTARFSVSMINVTLDDNKVIVENLTVNLKLNGDAEGNLTVIVGDKEFIKELVGGAASVDVVGLSPGTYTATVVYSGDDKYSIADKKVVLTVPKIQFNLDNLAVQSDSVSVDFGNDATGMLTVNINGKVYSAKVVDGIANVNIAGLAPGNYSAIVTYSGDNNYTNASKSVSIEVPKIKVNLDDVSFDAGSDLTQIVVNLPADATGTIVVKVNEKEYSAKIIDGVSNINITGLAPGNYNLTLTYAGDNNYTNATKSLSIGVPKISINLDDVIVYVNGDSALISVSLPADVTGSVVVEVNGKNYSVNVDEVSIINVTGLVPGNYSATVTYMGDNNYTNASKVIDWEIPKVKAVLDNNTLTVDSGSDVSSFSISLPSDATGTLTVVVGNKTYSKELVDGCADIGVSDLAPGNYTAEITYSGDEKYDSITQYVSVNVPKADIVLDNDTLIVDSTGNSLSFSISLPSDATGTLTVTVDGKSYSEDLVDGKATVSIPELSEGSHNVTVTYSGDGKYAPVTNSTVVVIDPVNSTGDNNSTSGNNTDNSTGENYTQPVSDEAFSIPEDGSDYGISLPSDATGTLTVTVDGVSYTQTLVNGKATVSIPELSEGSHNVTVSYSGDSKYASITKSSVVVKGPVNSTGGNDTQPVSDEAFYIPENGSDYSISLPSDATGTLTVTVDGVPYTQTLVNGKATVSIPELSEGSHNITVTYSGDNKYAQITKSSVVVKEHVPVIKLTASNLSMLYTSGKYFKVRLTSDGNALPNQKVKITINGKTYTRTTNINGYASVKISLPPKAYTVKATYGNLTLTKKVTVKTVIQAKNVNAKKSSKSIKIKVTLKKVNKKYLKNKKVTLKFNKKTFKAKTNKKGVVTFTIKKNVYNKLKANKKYTYQVIYAKDKVKKSIKFKK